MKLIFDLDNTLFSANRSDYSTYVHACMEMNLKMLNMEKYIFHRRNSGLGKIAELSQVDVKTLRNKMLVLESEEQHEHDELILNLEKFAVLLEKSENIILTRRNSQNIVLNQLFNCGLEDLFDVRLVWGSSEKEVARLKAHSLMQEEGDAYFGDKCSDFVAAIESRTPFYWVNTGFYCEVCKGQQKYSDINFALDQFFSQLEETSINL